MKFIRIIIALCFLSTAFTPFNLTKEKTKAIIHSEITIPSEVIVTVPEVESIIEDTPTKTVIKPLQIFIDPNKIPITQPPWNYKIPGGETTNNLSIHLYNEHKVQKYLVSGWSLSQLRRLHAYCHNGYNLEELYEYF